MYPVPPLVTLTAVTDPVTVTVASADSPSYVQLTLPSVTVPELCVGCVVVEVTPAVSATYLNPLYFTLVNDG